MGMKSRRGYPAALPPLKMGIWATDIRPRVVVGVFRLLRQLHLLDQRHLSVEISSSQQRGVFACPSTQCLKLPTATSPAFDCWERATVHGAPLPTPPSHQDPDCTLRCTLHAVSDIFFQLDNQTLKITTKIACESCSTVAYRILNSDPPFLSSFSSPLLILFDMENSAPAT